MVRTGAVPRKGAATSFRVIDGQAVIMDAEGAKVHITNEVGASVWTLIDGKRTIQEIISALGGQLSPEDYDKLPADLGSDVLEFLDNLEGLGVIEMVEED